MCVFYTMKYVTFGSGYDPTSTATYLVLVLVLVLLRWATSSKKADLDEIWQDCSSSECASIDVVGFRL